LNYRYGLCVGITALRFYDSSIETAEMENAGLENKATAYVAWVERQNEINV